ncbi:hypothetical protein COHA_008316 [Chlorella ohadii]|uniref:Uncharacterized protein n=1 Tax=Chlorella ohadii TaxID=2649997 RepID=A0AAD5H1N3_9CHLO|nr:hypothetical protein COHA_008316 [Chlorella ohadii]
MSGIAHGRLCILSKLVHASERQWCRLVIPGAVLKLWQAIQREIKAAGSDFTIIAQSADGTRAWRFGARMTVQRPMLLELGPFYADNNVREGDTVNLYRDLLSNAIYVDVQRGPASQAAASAAALAAAVAGTAAAPAPGTAAELLPTLTIDPYVAAAAASATAKVLPCQVWTQHMGKVVKSREPAAAAGAAPKKRSPAHSEDDSDGDWSPTARAGSRSRGGVPGAGPLPLRRKLVDGQQASSRQSNSDEDSTDVYSAEQMRRFDALVDVAASLSQSPSLATSGQL